jgi:iron complex transport system substrate-binding protein
MRVDGPARVRKDRWFLGLAMTMMVSSWVCSASADAGRPPPARVVSIHLCTDQLLLALAERSQIASVSWFATDAKRSPMAGAARGVPVNRARAEEIIALSPDLVLAGALSGRATVRVLRKLGYRVIDLALATNFDDIRRQIRRVAEILGQRRKGAALIARMDRTLRMARQDLPEIRPLAVIYQPMGFTSGQGSLEHALLSAAGYDNLSDQLGMGALGHLTLERLVVSKPDLIINWMGQDRHPSLARRSYNHPVFKSTQWPVVSIPQKYWSCGAWYSADAVALLAGIRRRAGNTGPGNRDR